MQQQLKDFAKELGADIVGFCELPSPPIKELPQLSFAVSVGVKLSDGILKTIDNAPSYMYFHICIFSIIERQTRFSITSLSVLRGK